MTTIESPVPAEMTPAASRTTLHLQMQPELMPHPPTEPDVATIHPQIVALVAVSAPAFVTLKGALAMVAFFGGALFLSVYLLVESVRVGGDSRALVLGTARAAS